MDNVPVNTNGHASVTRNGGERPHGQGSHSGKPKKSIMKLIAFAGGAIIVALMIFGGWFLYQSSTAANIDKDKYQAVFFTNGQVYFGKLQSLNGSYLKITDVFYLQAPAPTPASPEDSENPQETSTEPNSDVQLIKLGSEVHGPVDEMVISKDQILFFENLKDDGKVTVSIKKYHTDQK